MTDQSPIKICHFGKYYPPAPGGIETHVRTLAQAQAAMGADVQVVCVNHADEWGHDVSWKRYGHTRTLREADGPVRVTRLGRSAHIAKLDMVPELPAFFHGLKENPPDILHVHTPNATMLLAMALLRPSMPIVITHHSDIVKQRKLYLAFAPFEQWVYARAARIVSDSADYALGSDMLKQHAAKVEVVPIGLVLSSFLNPSRSALDHAADFRARYGPVLWLSVGRCVYYKGFDTALRSLRDVPGKLMIIGSGPDQEALKRISQELGVADRVIWRGHATDDELAGAYQAATALWFPSNARSEGFGLVQVEAMASGCPVINTQIPYSGVAWVSQHDQTGLTTPVNDPAVFAAAANRLLADPALRERLARGARQRAVDFFAEKQMAAATLALYSRILGRMPSAAEPVIKPEWTLLPGGGPLRGLLKRPPSVRVRPSKLSVRT